MKVWKIKSDENSNGCLIGVQIGRRTNTSFFSSPAKSVDHAHLEYFKGRYPIITTEKRMNKFKELYKQLFN